MLVAPFHLTGGAVVVLLSTLASLRVRVPDVRLARWAMLTFCPAFIVEAILRFMLGSRGMPRRMHGYLPQFESLHQLVGVAGLVVVGAFVLLVVSFMRGQPLVPVPPPESGES